MKAFLYILLIISVLSCSTTKQDTDITRFVCKNCAESPSSVAPIPKTVTIVPLETISEVLLHNIESLQIADTLIFLYDGRALYSFGLNGKFIVKIGTMGEGPNEYYGINCFFTDEDKRQITIVDEIKSKLFVYDFFGNFISSQSIPLNAIKSSQQAILKKKQLIVNHRINFEDNVALTSFDGKNVTPHLSYYPITVKDYMYSLSNRQMCSWGEYVDFIMPLNDTVYSFTNNHISPKYVIDLPALLPPREKFVSSIAKPYSRILRDYTSQGYFSGFYSIFETNTNLLLEYRQDGFVVGYYLGNKQLLEGSFYLFSIKNSIEEVPFFHIYSSTDRYFVGAATAYNLIHFVNYVNYVI